MITAYRISKNNIIKALEDMNRSSDFHHPKVIKVDNFDNAYVVFVECNSSYPCREHEWREMGNG